MSTQRDETRLRLLDAARALLLKRDFNGVGLEDIAAAAGVSRQAVYKSHFKSKADLLLELVRHVHVAERLDELVAPVFAARSAEDMLEATIRAIVQIEGRVHDLAMALSVAAASDAAAARAWRDRIEIKRTALREALTRLESEGRLHPAWKVEPAVDMLAALVSVETYHQLVVGCGWAPEALVGRIGELCRAGLIVRPAGSRSRPKPRAT